MSREDDFFGDYDESPNDVDTGQEDTSGPLMDESPDEAEVVPVFEEPKRPAPPRAKPRAKKKAKTKPKPKAKKKTSKTTRKPAAKKTGKKKVSAKKKKSAKAKRKK